MLTNIFFLLEIGVNTEDPIVWSSSQFTETPIFIRSQHLASKLLLIQRGFPNNPSLKKSLNHFCNKFTKEEKEKLIINPSLFCINTTKYYYVQKANKLFPSWISLREFEEIYNNAGL